LAGVGAGRRVGAIRPSAARGAAVDPRPPRLIALRPDPLAALDARSREIRDPVEKLRFLRRSLERYEVVDHRLQALPIAPLRWLGYRLTRVDEARPLFSMNPNGALVPPRQAQRPAQGRARRTLNWAVGLLIAAAGLAIAAYPRARPLGGVGSATAPARPASVAEELRPPPPGVTPERIWLVESGPGFELYSNGLRIDSTYAVAGEPRRYRAFDPERGMGLEVSARPVGIVFHTSESDIWPLEESFNERLRDSSQNLLRYLRRHRAYHYLVDRFGQVFRVVEENDKANHAGVSVWMSAGRLYLNLNGSTVGICFETRWEGGRALPITRAQLEGGRSLTDYLRAKWTIAPDMCVPHGLVSVNPKKHLIGHHVDWARGFPFAAFGLPDLYQRPAAAVALFGFGYDEQFLAVMGEPWPGVREAQRQLVAEAAAAGRPLEDVRRERSQVYDRWLAEQVRDAEENGGPASAEATEPPGRKHSGG
jgi:hypothetical protein